MNSFMSLVRLGLIWVLLGCGSAVAGDAAYERVSVTTLEGPVRGFTKGAVNVFLGIPYAAPPVGRLRWQPPRAVKPWAAGLDAAHYGGTCPQVSTLGVFAGPPSINEDCLYLNVFTTARAGGGKKPVLVWIHGGGNIDGESNDYDATKLAGGGPDGVPTVVVTFNYRLGLFGTFSHPAINAEGHLWGNYGTLDQQAVLRWVQRNISAFGGDPGRVTVGGQSAGSYNTGANVLSPLSKGLLHRAIFMSSPAFTYIFPTAERVLERGIAFAKDIGCPGSGAAAADCLRKLSPARILQLSGTLAAPSQYTTAMPFVDGTILPLQPEDAWRSGQFNKVPVIGGSTRDEYSFFTGVKEYYSGWPPKPMSTADYAVAVTSGAFCLWCNDLKMPAEAAAEYALSRYGGDAMAAYQRLNTDIAKCREIHVLSRWAGQVPVYAYDFTYRDAPLYLPKMPGLKADAAHTVDLQFLFNGYHGGPLGVNLDQATGLPRALNPGEARLSDELVAAWTRFAASGNPNGTGDRPWPRFTSSNAVYLVQDIPLSTKSAGRLAAEYRCDFWNRHLPYSF